MNSFVDALESRRLMSAASSTLYIDSAASGATVRATASAGGRFAVNLDDGKGGSLKGVQLGGIKVSHTGTLFVTGTGKADTIDLTIARGRVALNPYYAVVPVSADGQVFNSIAIGPRTGNTIKRVVVVGLGGDDRISIKSDVPVVVRGGTGNDQIGVAAPTVDLSGGSGNDVVLRSVLPPVGVTTTITRDIISDDAGDILDRIPGFHR